MKKSIYSLLILLATVAATAQPNPNDMLISGYVTDDNSGNAVSGQMVCVYADTTNQSFQFYGCDTTNANGWYNIYIPGGSQTGPNVDFIV